MAVNKDCRHYRTRSTGRREIVEICRMKANVDLPFACPEGCLFYEKNPIGRAGWTVAGEERKDR